MYNCRNYLFEIMEIILTNELIAKLYVPYLGATIRGNGKEYKLTLNKTSNRHDIDLAFVCDQRNYFPVLKSLSKISDEDMIWVYDENHNLHQQRKLYPEDLAKKTPSLKEMKDMISNGFAHYTGGYLDSSSVHQYLISKGYDVPLMLLGWKTLEQSGLAIYENEK